MTGHKTACLPAALILALAYTLSVAAVYAQGQPGRRDPAPELRAQGWVNLPPGQNDIKLAGLRGDVVVLLFFVAEEENSMLALDQAARLLDAYPHSYFKVIGVHSPPGDWRSAGRKGRPIDEPDSVAMDRERPGMRVRARPDAPGHRRRERLAAEDRGRRSLKAHVRDIWRRKHLAPLEELAVTRQVPFPVLVDHDRYVYTRYRVLAYPTFQLIRADGAPGPRFVGSRAYQGVSRAVDALLRERGQMDL